MTRRRLSFLIPALLFALTLSVGGVFLKDVLATGRSIYSDLALFNRVLNLVSTYYVEPTEPDSLIHSAIRGMLEDLDPHSNYIHPKRFSRMEERNRGSYSGVGISFSIRDGWLTVISPLEGGPSEKLGICTGDIITHIEGKSARGIKEQEVFEKLRGERGTPVHVTIRRGGEPAPLEFDIVRDDILIQSVPAAFMLEPGIGYIRMSRFSATTSDELEEALQALEADGMEKLILDLRGNSGGYLNQAVAVTDKFLTAGKKIVYTKGRIFGSSEEYYATDSTHPDFPMVVLINRGSASASEIVSGAIQDWDRGIVAGHTSFGKGLVQRQYPLPNGGALLLTVARYYTPSGRLIQRPYEAGEREEYYRHAGQADPSAAASGEEVSDDAAPVDSAGQPVHSTMLQGRGVSGGGGITPDVDIQALSIYSRINSRLIMDRKYFYYINMVLAEKKIRWDGTFEDYLTQFAVDDEMIDGFRGFLEADSFTFEPDSFDAHGDELRRGIRAELAHHIWGDHERYQIVILDDPAIRRAVELLPQAEAMLVESMRIEQQRAAKD
ncbi:MAG: S41 family peptidase [Candidatus Eisenbacteria sp.]|nr:S41 family peptidase [Candidatus Eisenbacteria bacterium]